MNYILTRKKAAYWPLFPRPCRQLVGLRPTCFLFFPFFTKVFPSVTKFFPSFTKVFPLVTKVPLWSQRSSLWSPRSSL